MPTEPLLPSGWTLGPAGRLVIGDVSPYWYITINKVIIYKVIHLCILSISNISITYIFLNVIDIGDDLYSEVSLYLGDFFVVYDLWYIYIYIDLVNGIYIAQQLRSETHHIVTTRFAEMVLEVSVLKGRHLNTPSSLIPKQMFLFSMSCIARWPWLDMLHHASRCRTSCWGNMSVAMNLGCSVVPILLGN